MFIIQIGLPQTKWELSSPPEPPPQLFNSAQNSGFGQGGFGEGAFGGGVIIQGDIDGVNRVFTLGVMCKKISVARGGIYLAQNYDYYTGPWSGTVVFSVQQTPQIGDVLQFIGWPV